MLHHMSRMFAWKWLLLKALLKVHDYRGHVTETVLDRLCCRGYVKEAGLIILDYRGCVTEAVSVLQNLVYSSIVLQYDLLSCVTDCSVTGMCSLC